MYTCVDCVSRVSVSSALLAVEILRKNDKACESGQMSSNTILIGISSFRFGGEKSVHGRPSWELAPYDCPSQNTVMKILPCGVSACRRNAASMIALENAEWFDLQHNFYFGQGQSTPY